MSHYLPPFVGLICGLLLFTACEAEHPKATEPDSPSTVTGTMFEPPQEIESGAQKYFENPVSIVPVDWNYDQSNDSYLVVNPLSDQGHGVEADGTIAVLNKLSHPSGTSVWNDFLQLSQPLAALPEASLSWRQHLIVGPFNRNGSFDPVSTLDMIIVDSSLQRVEVWKGTGNQNFEQSQSFRVELLPIFVVSGQWNDDNQDGVINASDFLDIAVINKGGNTLSVLFNDGYAAFASYEVTQSSVDLYKLLDKTPPPSEVLTQVQTLIGQQFTTKGAFLSALTSVLGEELTAQYQEQIFKYTTTIVLETGLIPMRAVTGDWNHDGAPDLATLSHGESKIKIWLNEGTGKFTKVENEVLVEASPSDLKAGDWDHDGVLDLAVTSNNSKHKVLSLLYGEGTGRFGQRYDLPAGKGPASITVADFNGDQVPDFAIANQFYFATQSVALRTGDVVLLLSNGTKAKASKENPLYVQHSFAVTSDPMGSPPSYVFADDINQDSKPDLILALPYKKKLSILIQK
ncbi:VCBS repeat-containing protein [Deltaproteobacteria bacterium TL4]